MTDEHATSAFATRLAERAVSMAEWAGRGVVFVALVVSPWANGGYSFFVQSIMGRAASLALLLCLIVVWCRPRNVRLPVCLGVLFAGLLLGFGQTISLPGAVVSFLSPELSDIRASFDGPIVDTTTLSVGPELTRRQVSLLLVGICFFLSGLVLFRTRKSVRLLFFVVAANGVLLAVWGIVQKVARPHELLPGVAAPEDGHIFSAWVNHSSAAGYLTMCLAAAIGLLVHQLRRRGSEFGQTWRERLLAPGFLFACLASSLILAGIVLSLSRGAWLSTGVAVFVALAVLSRRIVHLGLLAGAAIAVVCIGILFVSSGQWNRIEQRLATMDADRSLDNGRLAHWQDGLRTSSSYLTAGSGLGTYGYVYLLNETSPRDEWFDHAHNQYLETLVDAGLPGLALLLLALGLTGGGTFHLLRDPARHWMGVACAFLLAAQAVHAVFDFGLYMSANMSLLAVFAGVVFGNCAVENSSHWLWMPRFVSWTPAWVALMFACCFPATQTLHNAARVDAALNEPLPEATYRKLSNAAQPGDATQTARDLEDIAERVERLNRLVRIVPDDPHLLLARAELRIRAFRLGQALRMTAADQEILQTTAWQNSSLLALHERWVGFSADERAERVHRDQSDPLIQHYLKNAHNDLRQSRKTLPFLPRAHCLLAMMAPRFEDLSSVHLERTRRLSHSAARERFLCGVLAMNHSESDSMCSDWRQVLNLNATRYEPRILNAAVSCVGMERTVRDVIPQRPEYLVQLDRRYGPKPGANSDTAVRFSQALLNRTLEILDADEAAAKNASPDQLWLRGYVLQRLGRTDDAIVQLSEAVFQRPSRLEWRFRLATALRASGQLAAAREHAVWCARMKPSERRYTNLLRNLDAQQNSVPHRPEQKSRDNRVTSVR